MFCLIKIQIERKTAHFLNTLFLLNASRRTVKKSKQILIVLYVVDVVHIQTLTTSRISQELYETPLFLKNKLKEDKLRCHITLLQ